ncbi:MAG: homocysteine S-methyltransferase family protein [Planctomycetota bacterium]
MTGPPRAGRRQITLLDGPLGTELERRGLALPAPLWSARAVLEAPGMLSEIHAEYARAGAEVHTSCTFRTTARALRGTAHATRWRELVHVAVELCRAAVGPRARVAGSIAPLEDCFEPQRTPPDEMLLAEHALLAQCLADAGCDLLLVETMPTLRELGRATRAAVATGLPVWSAVTLGPRGDFFDAAGLSAARRAAEDEGAQAFLINCTAPELVGPALQAAAAEPPLRVRLGAYANALFTVDSSPPASTVRAATVSAELGAVTEWPPRRYAAAAETWLSSGASILGGCCGTTPAHVALLNERFGQR